MVNPVGRLADVLEEHTLRATTNRSLLRTGDWVHECNGGCAEDIERRLRGKGIVLAVGRAIGDRNERVVAIPDEEVFETDAALEA